MSAKTSKQPRGVAILAVLAVVLVLTMTITFAITLSQHERREAGKSVHNTSMQTMADSTLQLARNFFAANYANWTTYLTYFVQHPVQIDTPNNVKNYLNKLQGAHPELFAQAPAGYSCFMYVVDNVDELPPAANNPNQDNDLLVYVGAVCIQLDQGGNTEGSQLVTELTAPLLFTPTANMYRSQASGGSQDNNNMTVVAGFR
jgi:hypothetical protein